MDVVLDQLFDLILSDLIVLGLEAPVLFSGVLHLIVHWVEVPHVEVWHHVYGVSGNQFFILEEIIRVL